MDCSSYFFDWDPINLQDYLILDMDMIIPETDVQCQEQAPSSINTDIFNLTPDSDSFFQPPKRQNIIDSSYHCNTVAHFANPNPSFVDLVLEVSTAFPKFRFATGNADRKGRNDGKKPPLSAQCRNIPDLRQEGGGEEYSRSSRGLGKLVPGGRKLNTGGMFQTAAKYVEFLQAQVGILQLIQNEMSREGSNLELEIRALLASQVIQEKFTSEDVCLVPKKMVQSLATDQTPKMFQEISMSSLSAVTDRF
ncbi:PREDICTED: transcription factor bHLH53-like [Tarenaya hassleriana]|uniref:transcription factor bHLH53-like n=1 Tax=Tarenaya hassleriana TaxID=28532 RepID=UPI00053C9385|nr:PREDICTED: transcription factor bHLH53-like [Tarenaya hassleriana]